MKLEVALRLEPRIIAGVVVLVAAACGPSGGVAAPGTSAAASSNERANSNGGSSSSTNGGARSDALPREVRTARAERVPWERTLSATGELAADEVALLATKLSGRVATLEVDLGSRVAAGATIATLESRDQELRVAQAEAAVAAARTVLGLPTEEKAGSEEALDVERASAVVVAQAELADAEQRYQRASELVKQDIGTQATLDSARAARDAALGRLQTARETVLTQKAVLAQRRADLEVARQALADTRIVAPFDGIVGARMVARGDYLSPGTAIARLVRVNPLRLRLEIPERDVPLVRADQPVHLEVEGTGGSAGAGGLHSGRLVRLAPTLGARNRTLTVEAEIANDDASLRPGSFVRAQIVVDPTAEALVVPRGALVSFAGIDKVFVVREATVEERRVRIGRRTDERIEILDGPGSLAPGDEVVVQPGNLQSGAAVRASR